MLGQMMLMMCALPQLPSDILSLSTALDACHVLTFLQLASPPGARYALDARLNTS